MQAERRTIKLAWNCSSEAQLILFKDIANREKNNQACLELFFRGAAYLIQRYCKSREEQSSLLGIVLPRRSLSYSKILQIERRIIKLAWNCSSEAQLILFKDIANREKNNQVCLELFFRNVAMSSSVSPRRRRHRGSGELAGRRG